MPNLPAETPLWITIFFLALITFRKEIFSLLPSTFKEVFKSKEKRDNDEREHQQRLEDRVIQTRLKLLEDEYNEKAKHETELQALLRAQTDLISRLVSNELQALNRKADLQMDELSRQRRALLRLTDIIAVLYSKSMRQNGEAVQQVINTIETILEPTKEAVNGETSQGSDKKVP